MNDFWVVQILFIKNKQITHFNIQSGHLSSVLNSSQLENERIQSVVVCTLFVLANCVDILFFVDCFKKFS